ncbi:MAG: class I SAM-dependent methyltransferase, partial [Planctomycetota bacterium]
MSIRREAAGLLAVVLSIGSLALSGCTPSDEAYFRDRAELETKHFDDVLAWRDHFAPDDVLLCGVGMGQRVYAFDVIGVDARGFDISAYAVERSPYKARLADRLYVGDITDIAEQGTFDLVVAYDVLEHLSHEQLDQALPELHRVTGGHLLVSLPVIGDPNLERDPTHLIAETRA